MHELAADIVVIGGGPAGLEAACAAARLLARGGATPRSTLAFRSPSASASASSPASSSASASASTSTLTSRPTSPVRGSRVVLVDSAAQLGGQVWRARRGEPHPLAHAAADVAAEAGVHLLSGRQVVGVLPGRELLLDGPDEDAAPRRLRWRRLVLATGARERLLPFPGWTLPGVFGAGGLQALAKGGWPIAGQRVVVAGTGPLLLAAAVSLQRDGAEVVQLVDEVPWSALARFGATLVAHPAQGLQAIRFAASLAGIRLRAGWRIVEAKGAERLESVVLAPVGASVSAAVEIACDALATGWGLVPETGLARALDCALVERFGVQAVRVDEAGRTSRDDVFAAGETTGIAGARAARITGRRAGEAAAFDLADRGAGTSKAAPSGASALAREHRFAAAVARCFTPPSDLAARLTPQTIVCRCEDVPWQALRDDKSLRATKLATRCGMGHCQGRLCHDALALITGAAPLEPRLPLFPVDIGVLLAAADAPAHAAHTAPFLEPAT